MGYDILLILFGAVLGFGSSAAFWWFQSHYFVPKVVFCEEISKKKNPFTKRGWMYRVKFVNKSRRRAIDITTIARIAIRGLHYNNLHLLPIPTSINGTPMIGRNGGALVTRLVIADIPLDNLEFFPNHITEMARNRTLTLEHLLKLGTDAYLRLFVTAYDEFSGARKLYTSKLYRLGDIRKGKFSGIHVVQDNLEIEGWEELTSDATYPSPGTGDNDSDQVI